MKKITKNFILIFLPIMFFLLSFSFSQKDSRGLYGSEPIEILDNIVAEANKGGSSIQETALDDASDMQGSYSRQYKIANTLDYIRQSIYPYMQRAIYIGLVLAVILIIYNGFLMVTNSLHKEGDMAKVKKNLINITIGVLLLTGFYAIIKIVVGLINSIFGGYGGASGF